MKGSTPKVSCFVLAVMLGVFGLVGTAAAQECSQEGGPLESTAYYFAVNNQEVDFQDGVYWEAVTEPDGQVLVRFGWTQEEALAAAAANTLECRCSFPTVCVENTCEVSGVGTGNATCRGGCYRADGTACVSCRFF